MKVQLGTLDEFPNGIIVPKEVNGKKVCITKVENNYRVFDNKCPHQGVPLEDGIIRKGFVTCCLHGWIFNLEDGSCGVNPHVSLKTYPTEIEGESLFATIESE